MRVALVLALGAAAMTAVTDTGCAARRASTSRNASSSYESLLAAAEALMPPVSDDERAGRRRSRRLAATPTHCWKCDRELSESDELWRLRKTIGVGLCGGQMWAVVPWCAECSLRAGYRGWRAPCVTCRRVVVDTTMTELRDCRGQVIACSDDCRKAEHTRRKAESRRELQPRPCQGCSEHFTPARADGRYCSSACRQRAYRERQREQAEQRERDWLMLREYDAGLR